MTDIEYAVRLVRTLYPKKCSYDIINMVGCNGGIRHIDALGVTINNGLFRCVIISNKRNIVIKTGRNDTGHKQCLREIYYYKQAENWGLEHHFAKCLYKFCHFGHWFYVYEKVPNIGYIPYINDPDDFHSEIIGSEEGILQGFNSQEEVDELEFFLRRYKIGDIHDQNCGFQNDSVVIVDYAGFKKDDIGCSSY